MATFNGPYSRIRVWSKILAAIQSNKGGGLAHNDPKNGDTLREILIKILRALQDL